MAVCCAASVDIRVGGVYRVDDMGAAMRTIERFKVRGGKSLLSDEEIRAITATATSNKATALKLDNGNGKRDCLDQTIRLWASKNGFICHIKRLSDDEIGVWVEPKKAARK